MTPGLPKQPLELTESAAKANFLNTGKKNLWTLYFRAGSNPHAMTKHFFLEGDIRDVVTRAKKHCDTLGYRFIRIEPFISDLALDERKHTGLTDEN